MPCRKISYYSRAEAMLTVKGAVTKLRPYRCQDCGLWHLTSKPRAAYRRSLKGEAPPIDP